MDNGKLIAIVFLVVGTTFGLHIGRAHGNSAGRRSVERAAVQTGVAEYFANEHGAPEFRWLAFPIPTSTVDEEEGQD